VPLEPSLPLVPLVPLSPDVPEEPSLPAALVPEVPVNPEVPDDPVNPDVPDAAEVPDVPASPEVPDEPDNAEVPDEPEVPDVPNEVPEVPAEPDEPEPVPPPPPKPNEFIEENPILFCFYTPTTISTVPLVQVIVTPSKGLVGLVELIVKIWFASKTIGEGFSPWNGKLPRNVALEPAFGSMLIICAPSARVITREFPLFKVFECSCIRLLLWQFRVSFVEQIGECYGFNILIPVVQKKKHIVFAFFVFCWDTQYFCIYDFDVVRL
jgi:hypothetical protein